MLEKIGKKGYLKKNQWIHKDLIEDKLGHGLDLWSC